MFPSEDYLQQPKYILVPIRLAVQEYQQKNSLVQCGLVGAGN